jgi:hypothetical protein
MLGRRREVSNKLIEQINSSHPPTFPEFILSPDLPEAICGESAAVVKYLWMADPNRAPNAVIRPTSVVVAPGPYLHTLVDYALSDIWNTEEDKVKFRLAQLNRNASTVLGNPFRKLWNAIDRDARAGDDYVSRRILDFPTTKFSTDPVFAGHWQRIIENFFHCGWDLTGRGDDIKRMIDFCISHIEILPYQQLLTHFPIDFPQFLDEVPSYSASGADTTIGLMCDILGGAARHVFAVNLCDKQIQSAWRSTLLMNARAFYDGYVDDVKAHYANDPANFFQVVRPLVWKGKKPMRECLHERLPEPKPRRVNAHRHKERWASVGFNRQLSREPAELVKLRCYHSLIAIRSIIAENPDMAGLLQASDEGIERILMCGVYADPGSMIAPAAFQLLEFLVYGFEEYAIPPATNPRISSIIEKYAGDFTFSENITAQIAAAFPIFWRHRYPDLAIGGNPISYPKVVCEYDQREQDAGAGPAGTWEYTRPPGLTPLELYGVHLLDEPPLVGALTRSIMKVLRAYDQECEVVRASAPGSGCSWEEYRSYQKAVYEKDIVFLDFLRTRFPFGSNREADMTVAGELCPLSGLDKTVSAEKFWHIRVPLNGAIVEFLAFVRDSHFFTFGDRTGQEMDFAPNPMLDHAPGVMVTGDVADAVLKYTTHGRQLFEVTRAPTREESDMDQAIISGFTAKLQQYGDAPPDEPKGHQVISRGRNSAIFRPLPPDGS